MGGTVLFTGCSMIHGWIMAIRLQSRAGPYEAPGSVQPVENT
jgi:hypothetical protein